MKCAIYAFSGDPITYGHIDIVKRAAQVFDRVVVGIGVNLDKEYTFTLKEREDMAKKVLRHLSNVEVISFEGLLVDYAKERNIPVIVKGVRDANDFQYEVLLYNVGESQKQQIDTFLIPARKELAHVSSTAVKVLQKDQGLVHEYVPLYVKQRLEEKISNQFIVGVTGEIGAGKTYVSEEFARFGREKGIQVHILDMDMIGHQILEVLREPLYVQIRKEIAGQFGQKVLSKDGFVKRKELGKIVFADEKALQTLNRIMYEPLLLRIRREMYGKKGLILVNSALLVEAGWAYLYNNNILLVHSDKASQLRRLGQRNLSEERMGRRVKSQYSFDKKKRLLREKIINDNQGKIFLVKNSDNSPAKAKKKIFLDCLKTLNLATGKP